MKANFSLLNFHQPDCPEITCQVWIGEIGIRHPEVALQSPARAPGISDDVLLVGVVVSHHENRMAANRRLARLRHRNDTVLSYLRRLEAAINSEPNDKGISRRQTRLHVPFGL